MVIQNKSKPNGHVLIAVDNELFVFLVYLPGEAVPRAYVSVDDCLRTVRNRLQEMRYDKDSQPEPEINPDEVASLGG